MVKTEDIKKLREESGLPLTLIRAALEEAAGDLTRAKDILRAKSELATQKKSGRTLGAGTVSAYVHNTKTLGALVELGSETDFVAKNEEFQALAYDIAMQVSATNPGDLTTLLAEPFSKDPSRTVGKLIDGAVQKFGERVEIIRFARFSV